MKQPYEELLDLTAEQLFLLQEILEKPVSEPAYNFAVKSDGERIFVYPLEERELVYLAQTTGLSKFNIAFEWFEVTEEWVIRARKHGWVFGSH